MFPSFPLTLTCHFLLSLATLSLLPSRIQVTALSISSEIILENILYKRTLFSSAPKYAVYGASDDDSTLGTQVFKFLLEDGKDVVPINPLSPTSQGIPCLRSLHDLPDPKKTAISITTHPSVALEILLEAHNLDVHLIWLHPSGSGVEEDLDWGFVMQYLATHPEVEERVLVSSLGVSSMLESDEEEEELVAAMYDRAVDERGWRRRRRWWTSRVV